MCVDSYINVKGWITEIDRHGAEGVHKLLIGNKADLIERKVVDFEAAKVYIPAVGPARANVSTGFPGVCPTAIHSHPGDLC